MDVYKRFGSIVALSGLSLSIDRGESLGLVGPNGAGKTTTVRVSIGVLRRDSGSVRLFGEDPWLSPRVRRYVGVVHDKPSIPEGFRCLEWLLRVCRIYGVCDEEARRVLELVGLWSHRFRRVKELSAGMRQRLALAQALVHNPELLVMDEPFANIDPPTRASFIELLGEVKSVRKVSILVTSHSLEDVLSLASSIAIIHRGRIVFKGSTSDVEKAMRVAIVRVRCSDPRLVASRAMESGVALRARVVDEQTVVLEVEAGRKGEALSFVASLSREGIEIADVETRAPSIEEFLRKLEGGGNG